MGTGDETIKAIARAVEAAPDDLALRAHLAALLIDAGRHEEALEHAVGVLTAAPAHVEALRAAAAASRALGDLARSAGLEKLLAALDSAVPSPPIRDRLDVPDTADGLLEQWADSQALQEVEIGDLTAPGVRLADVGGMTEVKRRLEVSFLAPMRNPSVSLQFGKSMRGGLLLWGPPGCGKTFIARATAGELGASFYEVRLSDVLDMWIGSSERNLTAVFDVARRNAPCVLFFDEIDALGQKRTQLRGGGSAMRGVVNQLLSELDGATVENDGVFVLAATNHPWDIDPALLRPGRLDRTVLVLPPDREAREAILRLHLRGRPVERLDLSKIAKATDGYSGADLALLCEEATETAMTDSLDSGTVRLINQRDLERALHRVHPSIESWLATAKNFAIYSDDAGRYDELLDYLKRSKR
jgi:SpoVK/Ycf46/Vps4 family AAA+-type ATPase